MAAKVWLDKYALHDADGNRLENTPRDTQMRMAKELAAYSQKYSDPMTTEECYKWLEDFKYIVPQGGIMYGLGNPYSLTSLSNCFVIDPPRDSYPSIIRTDANMVELMKRRGGVGTDLSNIRSFGEFINNAAKTSCGVTPIMERYSNTTKEVGQGGRRGALMLSIDVNHKDIRRFIGHKTDLKKCTGANVSIRVDDSFMKRVESGDEEATKTFDMFVEANRKSAEPGILFWDTILRESPFAGYQGWEEKSTNPCLTGDTLVAVADGRGYVSFEQLANEGEDVDVYCSDNEGIVRVRTMRNIRITGFKEETISVHFSNGFVVKCTPNHKFPMKNGEVKLAKDLKVDDVMYSQSLLSVLEVKENEEKSDVYNGTVDEFHNFFIGGFGSIIETGELKTSNLLTLNCGEVALTDGDSCRLLALNFYGFVKDKFTENARFDTETFKAACYMAVKMMDSVIDAEIDKIDLIIDKIEKDDEPEYEKAYSLKLWKHIRYRAEAGRRTGIGMTGLGDMLAALGYKYGQVDSSFFVEKLFDLMSNEIYKASQELAITRGAAPLFDKEFDGKSEYLTRKGFAGIPRRHIGLLSIAPTGTVSLMTQTTSGVEPLFLPYYMRKKKDENGTIIDVAGDKFVEYFVIHQPFKDWMEMNNLKYETKEDLDTYFSMSPWHGATTNDIDHLDKVFMQSLIQKHIDHSISVTMNLPKGTTKETIASLYMEAWKRGCKGLTVYVDGSREGVLNSVKKDDSNQTQTIPVQTTPVKRPKKLDGTVHFFKVGKENWCAFVGLLNSKPYEIFIGNATNYPYLKKDLITDGFIAKTDEGYQYESKGDKGFGLTITGLGNMFNKEYWNYAKTVSGMLRNGVSIPAIIDIVDGLFDNDSLHSFKSGMINVLKKYVKDGDKPAKQNPCPECDNGNFVYQEGCLKCTNCGYSKCG